MLLPVCGFVVLSRPVTRLSVLHRGPLFVLRVLKVPAKLLLAPARVKPWQGTTTGLLRGPHVWLLVGSRLRLHVCDLLLTARVPVMLCGLRCCPRLLRHLIESKAGRGAGLRGMLRLRGLL